MTPDGDFGRDLTAWLEEEAAPRAPLGLEAAFSEEVARQRQRPSWATTERWISMETRAMLGAAPRAIIIAITILLLAALAAGTFAIGASLTTQVPDPFGEAGNGVIAYTQNDAIWAAGLDGSEPVRLVAAAENPGAVVFSRDGSRFSYESAPAEDEPRTIMVRDADGSDPIAITDPLEMEPTAHAWSPDGQILLFSGGQDDKPLNFCSTDGSFCGSRIYRANTDGSGFDIIGDPNLDAQSPVWAPDGTYIVFAGSPADSGEQYGLYKMNPDGSDVERIGELTGRNFTFWRIDISPDGGRLVTQAGLKNQRHDIYVVSLPTGEATLLEEDFQDAYDATFSPDGSRILFSRNEDTNVWNPKPVIVDADTLELQPLDMAMWLRDWSPDGSSLIGVRPTDESIVILDVSGAEATSDDITVLEGTAFADDFTWQRVAP